MSQVGDLVPALSTAGCGVGNRPQIAIDQARPGSVSHTLVRMAKIQISEPVRVRLSRPADMAAAIPHLVGFRPDESLVVVSLRGPRKRIGLTMRFDLPPRSLDAQLADEIAVRLAADKAEFALVACCTSEHPDDGPHPRTELIQRLQPKLRERDVGLLDALLIRDGRWWSYLCDDPGCCPAEGAEIPAANDIAAAHALMGRAPLPTREALAEQIKPVTFVARRAMEQALDVADTAMVDHFVDHGYQRPVKAPIDLLRSLITRFADPRNASMSNEEAASLIAGTKHVPTRDLMIAAALGHDLDVVQALFIELSRRAFPPHDAPTCTLLAASAYADGNGALANVALDRAIKSDPHYSLAELLREALHRQVPPSLMREAWKDAEQELMHKPHPAKTQKRSVRGH
jgi:hypothetical protein